MNGYRDPTQHLFWLSSRALGIVAIVLLGTSVTIGLLMSGRAVRRPGLTGKLRNLHEALALSACAAIAGHGLLLLGDGFLRPGLSGITLPFTMATDPLWTGMGVIGGWLTAIFTFSFYVRRWIGTKTWRRLHRFTIAAYGLALVHTLGAGTDAGSVWMIVMLMALTTPIIFGVALKTVPGMRAQRGAGAV